MRQIQVWVVEERLELHECVCVHITAAVDLIY